MEPNEESEATNLEKFLKHTELNEDCLVDIFKYLSGPDLLNICDLDSEDDKSFTNLINRRVVKSSRIVYDFGRLPAKRVFERIGRTLERFKLRVLSDELSDFLNNIIKYCPAPALFREVTLILDPKHDKKDAVIGGPAFWPRFFLNNELWTQVRPIFQYIEKLNITYLSNYRNFAPRLPAFFGEFDFPNIKSLTLQHFSMEKDWKDLFLNPQMCANLTELRLFDFYIEEDINEFKKLINRLPNLEVFAHTTYGLNIDAVSEVLHQRFPNLRGFGFRTNSPIDANDGDSDDDDDQFIARYDIDGDRTITLRDEELKCLEKFKNLTEFYLDTSECQCRNLSSVFRFVPNIKVLGMWEIGLFHPEEDVHRFIGTIRQTITNRRDRFPSNNDRVHLFVNQEQFNILNSVENIKNIIRLTVQHQSRV